MRRKKWLTPPALGCCGLCDKDATVLMTVVENKKNVCNYRVDLSLYFEPKIDKPIVIEIQFQIIFSHSELLFV